jgi:hypothetical protein
VCPHVVTLRGGFRGRMGQRVFMGRMGQRVFRGEIVRGRTGRKVVQGESGTGVRYEVRPLFTAHITVLISL